MRILNENLLNAAPNTLTSTSAPLLVQNMFGYCMQAVFTGTPTGTFKLQASNDPGQFPTSPTNWADVASSSVSITTGGVTIANVTDVFYNWARVVYTSTATGVQTITAVADVAGSLNSKYFLLNSEADAHKYYVWFDDGTGIDPAVPGRTGVHITYTDGDSANTIASDLATAIAALNSTNDFTASATLAVVTVTNKTAGPFTAMANVNTPFTFGLTTPSGTITVLGNAKGV